MTQDKHLIRSKDQQWWQALALRLEHHNNLSRDRGSHLNMLVLATVTQPANEISATMQNNYMYHCYRLGHMQVCCRRQRSCSVNSSGLKSQQLHPCTVCTSDGIHGPESCFIHNLMWWAPQLVHTGDESRH